jgi:cytosine/adenosine deaminase-related metal-dependent hydrolase
MNENQIADIWLLFKEYVDRKTIEAAAERYVDLLVDHGVSDKVLESVIGHDDFLDEAIEYYLEDGAEEEEYEEDNWNYDDEDQ